MMFIRKDIYFLLIIHVSFINIDTTCPGSDRKLLRVSEFESIRIEKCNGDIEDMFEYLDSFMEATIIQTELNMISFPSCYARCILDNKC